MFERCEREWSVSGFRNQETMEFSLRGYDDAGNVASPLVYQWTIGNDVECIYHNIPCSMHVHVDHKVIQYDHFLC